MRGVKNGEAPVALATESTTPATIGLCWDCNYSLRGLPENRCPECGKPFDPADPATMNMGRPLNGFARRALSGPGMGMHVPTLLAFVGAIVAGAGPTPYPAIMIPAVLLWLIVGIVWVVRSVIFLFTASWYDQPILDNHAACRRFALLPVLAVTVIGLLATWTPLRLAVLVSLPSLEQAAATGQTDGWVGLFLVGRAQGTGAGVELPVYGTGRNCGLARYEAEPVDTSITKYYWIWGNWYAWVRRL